MSFYYQQSTTARYATFEEDVKGSIEAGRLADFVILSEDPTQVDPFAINDIAIEAVYIDGNPVLIN